ncbi:hypothetical protein SEA_NICOLE72_83 [Microbacterium phage Nicole72]|uniref:Uncharacterized protein n=1 Tax=Microbacterium phage Nicole72 TaxID=3062838 RepID=A0ACD4UHR8_9CAUD|nr:hypothetical protein SEA_NICOLE72_83 [Microbacterium phage Nicole72]
MGSQFFDRAASARWAQRQAEVARDKMLRARRPQEWPPPVRDPREEEPPHAEVEQTGWCSWSIRIMHGWMQWGPDGMPFTHVGTRKSAEARARRLLARYTRKYERERQARIEKRRIELVSPEEFQRGVEHARATEQALADLRDPDGAWEREFAALDTRRRSLWRRQRK